MLAIARMLSSFPGLEEIFRSVVFIANVGEEGEGNLSGMRYLCRQSATGSRIRSFLILDGPNTDHITSQALASRRFDVTITGPGGHSWSDYGIANPVHALARAIAYFTENRFPGNGSPRSSYNFGIIEGGSSINSIPSQARTKVDIRSQSAAKIDEIASLLTGAVERALESENDRAAWRAGSPARSKRSDRAPGGRLADDAPIPQYIRAVDAHLGIRSLLDCASTDANIPLSLGLPAISVGAGGQGRRRSHLTGMVPPRRPCELGLRRALANAPAARPQTEHPISEFQFDRVRLP